LFVLARFAGLISVLSSSASSPLEPINFHEFHSTLSLSGAKKEKKLEKNGRIQKGM
jgi:hypothetical protein